MLTKVQARLKSYSGLVVSNVVWLICSGVSRRTVGYSLFIMPIAVAASKLSAHLWTDRCLYRAARICQNLRVTEILIPCLLSICQITLYLGQYISKACTKTSCSCIVAEGAENLEKKGEESNLWSLRHLAFCLKLMVAHIFRPKLGLPSDLQLVNLKIALSAMPLCC